VQIVQIHWRNAQEIEDAQREAVEQRLQALAEGRTDLIDLWIDVKTSGHHRHGGREVGIRCQARGHELVASRARPDAGLALDEVVAAFEREVRRMRGRLTTRRVERPAEPPLLGIVDRVLPAEDHGFILTDSGERVYFHRNAVRGALSFDALEEGQRFGLDVEAGAKGPQATAVVEPPPDVPSP
jgi:cold shock CspA family protein/ribosome-associated translation inhibitor RaiA